MRPRNTGATRTRRPVLWISAIAAPIAIGAVLLVPLQANAAVDLPDKSVEELLEFASQSEVDALSGTIEQRSELGLPDLAGLTGTMGGGAGATGQGGFSGGDGDAASGAGIDDLVALVTGSHTAKVYLDGENARLQVLDRLAERNVYLSADEAWFVDSEAQTATRLTLESGTDVDQLKADAKAEAERLGDEARAELEAKLPDGETLPTPQELADRALERLDETTEVTVGTDARVAGREVYELILEPRTDDTLVGEIRLAIDGENGAALAASVTARGASEPAFELAFSEVSFQAPDASAFEFEPADNVTVTEQVVPLPTAAELEQLKADAQAKADGLEATEGTDAAVPTPIVHGEGWATVVELDAASALAALEAQRGSAESGAEGEVPDAGAPDGEASGTDAAETSELLDTLTERVDGGRVLQTSLVTVLLTDDGRVFAGSVPADRLVELAAGR